LEELTAFMSNQAREVGNSFSSEFFFDGEGRFLFRGGLGEILFIDKDGMMYRSKGWIGAYTVWKTNFNELRLLN